MMHPIADFLPVFAPGSIALPPSGTAIPEHDAVPGGFDAVPAVGISDDEVERRIAEARAEILAEAAAALEVALAEQAADFEARHAAELDRHRRHWAEAQAAALDDALRHGFETMEGRVADSVAHVLEPFVEEAIRAEAAADLKAAVADLLAQGTGVAARIRGPADLVEPLRAAFADKAGLRFEVADAAEVTIETDDTLIRSQLGAWTDRLRTAMEETQP